jgi:hypothetical protein
VSIAACCCSGITLSLECGRAYDPLAYTQYGRPRRASEAANAARISSSVFLRLSSSGDGVDRFVEPRFRAGARLPQGARAAFDGGLGEAASGNLAVAAVTSWSRARRFQGTTCAVPVGGAAPADASVRALSHPDAYPISFVTLKRLRQVRPIVAAFLKYLTGPRAADSFRQRGMLLVKEAWPAVRGPKDEPFGS